VKGSKGIEDEWGNYNKGYMGNTGRTDMEFGTGMLESNFLFSFFGVWEGYHRIWDDNDDMGLLVYIMMI
jgi:hypothetical protein